MTAITWYKAPHGLPADERWPMIAKRAGAKVGEVVATVTALWDFASRNDDRGSVQGFDPELVAALYEFEQSRIEAILTALADKAVIVAGRLADWAKSQGAAVEKLARTAVAASTERVRRHRRNKAADARQGDLFVASSQALQEAVSPVSSGVTSATDRETERERKNPSVVPPQRGDEPRLVAKAATGRRAFQPALPLVISGGANGSAQSPRRRREPTAREAHSAACAELAIALGNSDVWRNRRPIGSRMAAARSG